MGKKLILEGQGSILGWLFSLTHINDLSDGISSLVKLFGNETSQNKNDSALQLKVALSTFEKYCFIRLNESPLKWWKMLFMSSQKLFSFSRYLSFCFCSFGHEVKTLETCSGKSKKSVA